MANYPQELAQDAVCQSHTGHMTGLWFLPTRPLSLNTNERMNIQLPNVMKILPLGAELSHEDRRTDRHDEGNIITSRDFAKAPTNNRQFFS